TEFYVRPNKQLSSLTFKDDFYGSSNEKITQRPHDFRCMRWYSGIFGLGSHYRPYHLCCTYLSGMGNTHSSVLYPCTDYARLIHKIYFEKRFLFHNYALYLTILSIQL